MKRSIKKKNYNKLNPKIKKKHIKQIQKLRKNRLNTKKISTKF